VFSNAGAVAAERAQVQREYMLRKQEAMANRARGVGGALSPYVSQLRHPSLSVTLHVSVSISVICVFSRFMTVTNC